MQFLDCSVALSSRIKLVTADTCDTVLQQISRLALQRMNSATVVTVANAITIATWNTLLTASDNTAITSIKRKFYGPTIKGTEPVKIGSNDNSTPNGRSQIVGESVPSFEGMFTGMSPQQFADTDDLFAEARMNADFDSVGAYIFAGDDQLIMNKAGGPIAIHQPYIGNPEGGELHKLTQFKVSYELDKDWYRNAIIIKLPFKHRLIVN